jgi:hypothetical protein
MNRYWCLSTAQDIFTTDITLPVLDTAELYGGKLVAAMDRQRPRDIVDVLKMIDRFGWQPSFVLLPDHQDHVPATRTQHGIVRSTFSEPGHDAAPWVRQRYRAAPAARTKQEWPILSGPSNGAHAWEES